MSSSAGRMIKALVDVLWDSVSSEATHRAPSLTTAWSALLFKQVQWILPWPLVVCICQWARSITALLQYSSCFVAVCLESHKLVVATFLKLDILILELLGPSSMERVQTLGWVRLDFVTPFSITRSFAKRVQFPGLIHRKDRVAHWGMAAPNAQRGVSTRRGSLDVGTKIEGGSR